MKLLPRNAAVLGKMTVILILMLAISLGLFGVIFSRFRRLAASPPCQNLSAETMSVNLADCRQQTDKNYEISQGKVVAFPRCLTVLNSRFGSRLNFDWYFGSQTVRSGVLGNQKDADLGLSIWLESDQGSEPIFPISANAEFQTVKTELSLTTQKIIFGGDGRELVLTIRSPFFPSRDFADEAVRLSAAPYFYLTLSLNGKPTSVHQEALVLEFNRVVDGSDPDTLYLADGVRRDGRLAVTTVKRDGVEVFRDGQRGGLRWVIEADPFGKSELEMIFAGFLENGVMTDARDGQKREMNFVYRRWFGNIEEVITFARENRDKNQDRPDVEASFRTVALSPREKWMAAQAFHSYLANSFLVQTAGELEPKYLVWEGEFKLINTLDVAHDYGVVEGLYMPWVLLPVLDSWREAARKDEVGVVIPHDLGQELYFSGQQAYGIPGHETSGMPVEENANWLLLSWWYWRMTGDRQFLQTNTEFIVDLVKSLKARDSNNNGLADRLVRMTTYDNDGNSALKEAPEGVYLGIKQLAGYLVAAEMLEISDQTESATIAYREAELIVGSLKNIFDKMGYLPLTLDAGFQERSLFEGQKVWGIEERGFTIVNGLFYPVIGGLESPLLVELKPVLRSAFDEAYRASLVKDMAGKAAGLQLAENQALRLGWFSHSIMAEIISQKYFDQKYQTVDLWFPFLVDTPYGFADGQYFTEPAREPKATLTFYPRGAAIFGLMVDNGVKDLIGR